MHLSQDLVLQFIGCVALDMPHGDNIMGNGATLPRRRLLKLWYLDEPRDEQNRLSGLLKLSSRPNRRSCLRVRDCPGADLLPQPPHPHTELKGGDGFTCIFLPKTDGCWPRKIASRHFGQEKRELIAYENKCSLSEKHCCLLVKEREA